MSLVQLLMQQTSMGLLGLMLLVAVLGLKDAARRRQTDRSRLRRWGSVVGGGVR